MTSPGWYDDRATPGVLRWFDGLGWTAHTMPLAQPAVVAWPPAPAHADAGTDAALQWILPVGRSWQSITAGYVGLFALVIWPIAPVSILLGVLGLRRARTGGHGSGRSWFAVIAGVAGCVFGILYLASASA
jgi:hypothetical protein